ncbi:KinB-signaling pathway activation protein [Longirhabdus pacifica]|uniref:KinB-signaling pathway activation protein n=1 Tax=Longirhabdus pacifica TaxID=2305227 RepID=UPI0013E8BBF4|nr:KinB-signaling pathway activation protein [Longirhabdus pacifica]
MNLKKWFFLFWTTIVVGIVGQCVVQIIWFAQGDSNLSSINLGSIIAIITVGSTFSVFSQMGFFAYLTLNYIGRGFFKTQLSWQIVQWFLIVVVFVDLIIIPQLVFQPESLPYIRYAFFPIILFIISMIAAVIKSRLTKWTAFTPALFFLFVGTSLEVVPALRLDDFNQLIYMAVPILFCNVYQILILHKLLNNESNAVSS